MQILKLQAKTMMFEVQKGLFVDTTNKLTNKQKNKNMSQFLNLPPTPINPFSLGIPMEHQFLFFFPKSKHTIQLSCELRTTPHPLPTSLKQSKKKSKKKKKKKKKQQKKRPKKKNDIITRESK